MTFLNPILLSAGLACVALPIIIHILMRRRRRPIAWGAMKFLLEAYKQQRRRLNLEQILLLASRCLLVILLALALGKPILGAAGLLDQRSPRTLYILLDNSLVSSAVGTDNRHALESHKQAAKELLDQLDQSRGDRAAVITLGAPADDLVLPPTPDLPGAASLLKDLKPTDSRADLASALARVRDDLSTANESEPIVVVLSDFRAGAAEIDTTLPTMAGDKAPRLIAAAPADALLTNITIAAVEPLQAVLVASADHPSSTPVRVELRRSGPGVAEAAASKLRVEIAPVSATGGVAAARMQGAERVLSWTPGQESLTTTASVDLPSISGARSGMVVRASIDRDVIEGDNTFERPIDVRERLNVILVAPPQAATGGTIDTYTPTDWLSLALEPSDDGTLAARRVGEIRLSFLDPTRELADARAGGGAGPLTGADAIVVPYPHMLDGNGWKRLRAAADSGSLVLVSPSPNETIHAWTDAFLDAMSIDWTIARESRAFDPPMTIAPDRPQMTGADMFALIAPELAELVKPVIVSRVLPVQMQAGASDSMLSLADGTPLLLVSSPGLKQRLLAPPNAVAAPHATTSRGTVALLAAAPDLAWTDLPAKPLMVPLIQELVRQSVGRAAGTRVAAAGTTPVLPPAVSELSRLTTRGEARSDAASESLSIDSMGRPNFPIRHAGLWQARTTGGLSAGLLAINADPAAGRTDNRGKDDIARWLGGVSPKFSWIGTDTDTSGSATNAAAVLSQQDQRPPISFPLLLAAACVAAIELCLARFFSHAYAT